MEMNEEQKAAKKAIDRLLDIVCKENFHDCHSCQLKRECDIECEAARITEGCPRKRTEHQQERCHRCYREGVCWKRDPDCPWFD